MYIECSGEVLDHFRTRYFAGGGEGCTESLFRSSKEKGLKGKVDNVSYASYPATFGIESNLPYISLNFANQRNKPTPCFSRNHFDKASKHVSFDVALSLVWYPTFEIPNLCNVFAIRAAWLSPL